LQVSNVGGNVEHEGEGSTVTVDLTHRRDSHLDTALRGLDQAEEYVAGICFKTGPPRRYGIELEWTVHHLDNPHRPLDRTALAQALQPHTPSTLDQLATPGLQPDPLPLPSGNLLTVEPGGQVEISSQPSASLASLHATVAADVRYLTGLLARAGLRLGERGADPYRPPRRLLHTPRYDAMARSFAPHGPHGATMMCSTAAVQVCLDPGEPARVPARWAALHALGPVLVALFANSDRCAGRRTGWASSRMRAWLHMDPARTAPVPDGDDPARAWARYALRAPLLPVRRGRPWRCPPGATFADWLRGALGPPPTHADLDYHLSTLFPPVRPRGYVEVRYLDQQPPGQWQVPLAVLAALLSDESTVDGVRDVCAPVSGRWAEAARHGLGYRPVAAAARKVAALAAGRMAGTGLAQGIRDDVTETVQRRLAAH
jgi:glutamate--cysteine ligase